MRLEVVGEFVVILGQSPYFLSKYLVISKFLMVLTRLPSSSAQPEPGYHGTPTDYCKDQAVFDAGAEPFLFVSRNTGTDVRHL